jgi:hypothetical protein
LLDIARLKCIDQLSHLPAEKSVEGIEGNFDPMVSDAVLGEIVSPYFFFAPTSADETLSMGGVLGLFLAALVLE